MRRVYELDSAAVSTLDSSSPLRTLDSNSVNNNRPPYRRALKVPMLTVTSQSPFSRLDVIKNDASDGQLVDTSLVDYNTDDDDDDLSDGEGHSEHHIGLDEKYENDEGAYYDYVEDDYFDETDDDGYGDKDGDNASNDSDTSEDSEDSGRSADSEGEVADCDLSEWDSKSDSDASSCTTASSQNFVGSGDNGPEYSDDSDGFEQLYVRFIDLDDEIEVLLVNIDLSNRHVDLYVSLQEVRAVADEGGVQVIWYDLDEDVGVPWWLKALDLPVNSTRTLTLPGFLPHVDGSRAINSRAAGIDRESLRSDAMRSLQDATKQFIEIPDYPRGITHLRSYRSGNASARLPLDAAIHFVDDFGCSSELLIPVPAAFFQAICPAVGSLDGAERVNQTGGHIPIVEVSVPDVSTIPGIINVLIDGDLDKFFKVQTGLIWDPAFEDPDVLALHMLQATDYYPGESDIFCAVYQLVRMNFNLRQLQFKDERLYQRMDRIYLGWLAVLEVIDYKVETFDIPTWSMAECLRRDSKDFEHWFDEMLFYSRMMEGLCR